MNDDTDLDILRSVRADTPVDPDALARVRAAVVTPARPARRPWYAVAAGVAAVGLAGALLAPQLAAPRGVPVPPPAATARQAPAASTPITVQAFAADAAAAARSGAALTPAPDQYLRLTSERVGQLDAPAAEGKLGTAQAMSTLERVTLYVPGDAARAWVRVTELWTAPGDGLTAEAIVASPQVTRNRQVARAQDGAFEAPWDGASWTQPTQAWLRTLPADPAKLAASASGHHDALPVDHDALNLLNVLMSPLTETEVRDPQLRAAIFEAIGLVKGIEVTPGRTIGGQTGVGLKAVSAETSRITLEVVVSTDQYRPVGVRYTDGDRVVETTYRSALVDTAP